MRRIAGWYLAGMAMAGTAAADSWTAFREPPAEARPFVRWWWNGDCVTDREIRREIGVMHRAGIGGFEINPIAMPESSDHVPGEGLEWLSPEWIRMVRIATDTAREKGMVADLIVGSGWPFGGEFLREDQQSQRVAVRATPVEGPRRFTAKLADLLPEERGARTREGATMSLFLLRLAPEAPTGIEEVRDIRTAVMPDETVSLDVPAGRHRILAGALWRGFDNVMHGAPGAKGPVLDHYNRGAVRAYLDRMSAALNPAFGGRMGNGVRAVFCDSIELSRSNWTTDLPAEFRRRRGYDPDPWLPFVIEFVNPPDPGPALHDAVRRVRYDYCLTLCELFRERFIVPLHEWAHENGLRSRYQAYGHPWLMDMAEGYRVPDIPESNNWLYSDPDGHGFLVWTKYTSSGGHLSGRRIISTEAMTNTRGVFRLPLWMVKTADDANFVMGITHSVLHGFNYSPPEAGFPGWMRYGAYFSEQNPWWPWFPLWSTRNARLSAAFQAAKPAGDVAILPATADIWSDNGLERPPFHNAPQQAHQIWKALHANGVCADYVGESAIREARACEGRMTVGAMSYGLLVVAGAESIDPDTAEALARLADGGVRICWIAPLPSRSVGLHDTSARDTRVQNAVRTATAALHRPIRRESPPAMPELVSWADVLLTEAGIDRPVRFAAPQAGLTQIHYQEDHRDLFFVANLSTHDSVGVDATFAPARKQGQTLTVWDPESGDRHVLPVSEPGRWVTELGPQESRLVVCESTGEDTPSLSPSPTAPTKMAAMKISVPWDATFEPIHGNSFIRKEMQLSDISQSTDPLLAGFAGEICYRTVFKLDASLSPPVLLDLGEVHDLAEASVDGRSLGVRWYGRSRFSVPDGLSQGTHTAEVRVVTVLYNHMQALQGSKTAAQWVRANASREPAAAGLVGPVQIISRPASP